MTSSSLGCGWCTSCTAAISRVASQWQILLAGQFLSFLMASSSAAQATLSLQCHSPMPSITMGLVYSFLFLVTMIMWPCSHEHCVSSSSSSSSSNQNVPQDGTELKETPSTLMCIQKIEPTHYPTSTTTFLPATAAFPIWFYFLLALLDVYANYFTMVAFQYTTITSVTLLDACAIPSAMLVSKVLFRRQYHWFHYGALVLCIVGVIFNVFQDNHHDSWWIGSSTTTTTTTTSASDVDTLYPQKFRGNMLALTGGILFGISNVLGESTVRKIGALQYNGCLGVFGTLICLVQGLMLELPQLQQLILSFSSTLAGTTTTMTSLCSHVPVSWLIVAIVVTNGLSYSGTARFLLVSDATFLNLSLMTSDFICILFSVMVQKIVPDPPFYVALALTLAGVLLYEMAPTGNTGTTTDVVAVDHSLVLAEEEGTETSTP